MRTSCFRVFQGQVGGVSISIKPAPGFTGATYPQLFPKWHFLKQYKSDKNEEVYTNAFYKEVLDQLDPQQVYEDLKYKTLLCWEDPGKFCHRRLVAKWIENKLGIIVPEYKAKDTI